MLTRLTTLYVEAAQGHLEASDQRWARVLLELSHAGIVLSRETFRDRLPVRASMLAYWTSVAIVPLFLLAFALTRPMGLMDETEVAVRDFLLATIVAGSADELTGLLNDILEAANLRAMGVVGVAGVMVFGLQLYMRMERAYNDIVGARVRRTLVQRFIIFYSAVTLGPVLIAAGFVASARLGNIHEGINLISTVVPALFTATALIAALRILPTTEMGWRSSIVGGLVSALLFEFAKMGFNTYTSLFGTQDTMKLLYGSVGFLPVFLIWLNILWMVVLIGVEVAYIVEHWKPLMHAQRQRAKDPYAKHRTPDAFFALAVMASIAERYSAGHGSSTIEQLTDELHTIPQHIGSVTDVLVDAGLLVEAAGNAVIPSRPPESIEATEVVQAWRSFASPELSADVAGAGLVQQGISALDRVLKAPMVPAGIEGPKEEGPP